MIIYEEREREEREESVITTRPKLARLPSSMKHNETCIEEIIVSSPDL
jgi:hypothetical protein